MKQKRNKILIGAFLILGTLLSLSIVVEGVVYQSRYETLILRTGILGYLIVFDFLFVFPILGLICTYSYFTKGQIWKLLTKAIIVNIYIGFAYFLYNIIRQFIFWSFDSTLIILLVLFSWGLMYLWKAINSYNHDTDNSIE